MCMKIKFYLFSFLILLGMMSCEKEEAFVLENEQSSQVLGIPSTRIGVNPDGVFIISTLADRDDFNTIKKSHPTAKCILAYDITEITKEHLPDSMQSIYGLEMPNLVAIPDSMFQDCFSLTFINLDACTSIGKYAFFNGFFNDDAHHSLKSIYLPVCTIVGDYAFFGSLLNTIDLPACTGIGSSAFSQCRALSIVNLPQCLTIEKGVFGNCDSLTVVNLPKCTSIGIYAFNNSPLLTTVDLSACTSIGTMAFFNCASLVTVNLPKCTSVGIRSFLRCTKLTTMNLPKCRILREGAFQVSSITNLSLLSIDTIYTELGFYGLNTKQTTLLLNANGIERDSVDGNFWKDVEWKEIKYVTTDEDYIKLPNGSNSFYVYDRNVGADRGGEAKNYTNAFPSVSNGFKGTYHTFAQANPSSGKTLCEEYISDGWRTPTSAELEIINSKLKFSSSTAYLDIDGKKCYFPLSGLNSQTTTPRGFYWSSTVIDGTTAYGLRILPASSLVNNNMNYFGFTVRCVKTAI